MAGGGSGDDIHPDALSYLLVIQAWLCSCWGIDSGSNLRDAGYNGGGNRESNQQRQQRDIIGQQKQVTELTDLDQIERAMAILDCLEA